MPSTGRGLQRLRSKLVSFEDEWRRLVDPWKDFVADAAVAGAMPVVPSRVAVLSDILQVDVFAAAAGALKHLKLRERLR